MDENNFQIQPDQVAQSKMKKSIPLLVILILVVAGFTFFKFKPTEDSISPSPQAGEVVRVISLSKDRDSVLREFPVSMPLEVGANILSVSKQEYQDPRRILVSVQFYSSGTIDENLRTYEIFLKNNGYQITLKESKADFAALYGTASSPSRNFIFSSTKDASVVLVNLTYSK